ncbi:MAG TPA: lysophospholipid acyltransferase family protein [Actinophytocola sp.]|uniref:lysophospholipid acyltransferase family protein n=1 Tax=Actinophytocola sp. TaxID=1872138 RepID=UPI002DDCA691|nr:lysophospholipid acyltransferase family protein [Actinophytocola sp.]HEV2782120.1 lysophospholipid acyltransferase family protein [Actinophytocola sp.]
MSHAWMPTSPCGPHCITGGEPTVGRLRAAGRLIAAAGVVLRALAVSPLMPIVGRRGRAYVARWFFRAVLRAFGIRLAVFGAARLRPVPGRGALVVNNHISWLDIVAINAAQPMRAQAKSEVRSWPVIGRLADAAGTVYVDRERLRLLPAAVAELAEVMRAGSMVNVTPEGTSWCGRASGPFRAAAFQAAIDGGVPVIPIALRFRMSGGRETTAPAFIGDETLIDSILRVARLRGLVMEMHVLDELPPGRTTSRRELAALAEASISSALGRVQLPRQRRLRSAVRKDTRTPVSPH